MHHGDSGPPDYDLLVVGGGAAGLSAGIFGVRQGLRTAVVDPMGGGGQLMSIPQVDNFPGIAPGTSGPDMAAKFLEHANSAGVAFEFAEVTALTATDNGWLLGSAQGPMSACAVVLATGSRLRRLGVPGEARLDGKGVSYCGSCDGWLFKGKRMVVVGGGDSALDESLHLAGLAEHLTIVHRGPSMTGELASQQRVLDLPNVDVRAACAVTEIVGTETVEALVLRDEETGVEETFEVGGVAIYAGLVPNSSLVSGLAEMTEEGHLRADDELATTAAGLFVAGDVRSGSTRRLIDCAADGAAAALSARRYIDSTHRERDKASSVAG